MSYPTLYCRLLGFLRLVALALRLVARGCVVLDQRKWNRLEEFERSGYYKAGAPEYFF